MPSFTYKAIDPSGAPVTGVIEATDRKQVVQQLFAQDVKTGINLPERPDRFSHGRGIH